MLFQWLCRTVLAVKLGSCAKPGGTLGPEGESMVRLSEKLRAWTAPGLVPRVPALLHPQH